MLTIVDKEKNRPTDKHTDNKESSKLVDQETCNGTDSFHAFIFTHDREKLLLLVKLMFVAIKFHIFLKSHHLIKYKLIVGY